MTSKLYIGNLPSTATEAELIKKFSQFGPVLSAEISINTTTGRSTRTGYLEMETSEHAQAAIARLNMTQYDDVVISVSRVHVKNIARDEQGHINGPINASNAK